MKNLIVLIFIWPATLLAEMDMNESFIKEMKPLTEDLEKASQEVKICFESLNENDKLVEEGVSHCVKSYIARSFMSFCEEKTKLSSYVGEDEEVLKEGLEAKRNIQIVAVTEGIRKMREEFPLGEKFIEKELEVRKKAAQGFFLFLTKGLPVGGALGMTAGVASKLGSVMVQGSKALRKNAIGRIQVKSDLVAEGVVQSVISGMKGSAVGVTVAGASIAAAEGAEAYKEYKSYIYKLAGTNDLCQIK